jgi:hypothetical protein
MGGKPEHLVGRYIFPVLVVLPLLVSAFPLVPPGPGLPAASPIPSAGIQADPRALNAPVGPATSENNTSSSGPAWYSPSYGGASSPSYRFGESLVYDPLIPGDLLFGGYNNSAGFLSDTWILHDPNHDWGKYGGSISPSKRHLAMTAFSPELGGVVLFGGEQAFAASPLNDTWLFRNGNWSQLHPAESPPAKSGVMSWDATAGVAVLVLDGYPMQTWTFNGTTWTNIAGPDPTPRTLESMVYDPAIGGEFLFGGQELSSSGSADGTYLDDVWEFTLGAWSHVYPTTSPSPRNDAKLVYDSALGAPLLYGGSSVAIVNATNVPTYDNDTWIYQSDSWTLESNGTPVGRWLSAMTYDAAGEFALMVYGQNVQGATLHDTWVYHAALNVGASASAVDGDAPLNVSLSAIVSGGWGTYQPSWSIPGLAPSAQFNTTANFTSAGNHTARFSVTDGLGASTSVTFSIEVNLPVTVAFTASPPTGIAPLKVLFIAQPSLGTPPYQVNWSFGAGAYAAGAEANYTFAHPGHFGVILTVGDLNNESETVRTVWVNVSSPSGGPPGQPNGTSPSGTFLGLPELDGYALLGGAIAAIVGIGAALALRSRKGTAGPGAAGSLRRQSGRGPPPSP